MSSAYQGTKPVLTHLAERAFSNNFFLFFFFLSGFVYWRYGYSLVWDDTNVYKFARNFWVSDERRSVLVKLGEYVVPAFSEVSPSGYRPVGSLLQSLSILTLKTITPAWGHLLAVGCVIGSLAVAFKSISARFIKSKQIVFFCLVLFIFSSPVAQSSWIVYSGIPVFVPLFTCVCLLLYFDTIKRPKEGRRKLWLLALLVIFSSWYREFMVALPLTILGMEIIRARRITKISLLAGVLFLLSLFPTAIPLLLFKITAVITGYDNQSGEGGVLRNGLMLPLKPVFQLGNVHGQLSNALIVREEVSRHLLSIPSPSLLVLTFFGFVSLFFVKFYRQIRLDGLDIEGGLTLAASLIGLVSLAGMMVSSKALWPYHLGILTFILIAWVVDRRLAVWITVFLAPFYFVYTARLHLAYVIMPIMIVVAAVIEWCLAAPQLKTMPHKLMRFFAGIAIALGVLDASANLLAVRVVMARISDGIGIVAHKISEKASDRPVSIISNALHVSDLQLYLDGGYHVLWTVGSGHDRPQDTVETPEQLTKVLKAKLQTSDVYLLDIRQDYLPSKKNYHQHRFLAGCSVSADFVGLLHMTRAEYLMPDPLRWFNGREFYAFFGPPDLVNDFYYGPSPRPLFGKVEAEYHLYKVASAEVKDWLPSGQVSLIDGNYFGFSIVSQNGRYFAIPIGEGEFNYERVCRKLYSESLESSSIEEIKAMVKGLSVER